MRIKLIVIGKTQTGLLSEAVAIYEKRLKHYVNFEITVVPDIKNQAKLSESQIREKEGAAIISALKPGDDVVLLDSRGKMFTSTEFSDYLSKKTNASIQNLVFVTGGAYGLSDEVKNKAPVSLSLSPMTFTRQMVRLIFVEQLYRAFTILKGESYHHE